MRSTIEPIKAMSCIVLMCLCFNALLIANPASYVVNSHNDNNTSYLAPPPDCPNLATRGSVQLSMGLNCETEILASYIFTFADSVASHIDSITYVVNGVTINSNELPNSLLGSCIEVTAHVGFCNNSYTSIICLEDKDGPVITCPPNDTVTCAEAVARVFTGTLVDCNSAEALLVDEDIEEMCTGAYIQKITRKWVGRDLLGNISDTCTQEVLVERFNMATDLTMPSDTVLSCDDVGGIDVEVPMSIAGHLTISGMNLENNKSICNVSGIFEDRVLINSPCKKMTMRMWTINEWRCGTDVISEIPQTITVIDTIAPVITSLGTSDTLRYEAINHCEATVDLPVATIAEMCNPDDVIVDMFTSAGAVFNQNGGQVTLGVDTHTIFYVVRDPCHNIVRDTIIAIVTDKAAPLAVCNTAITVNIPLTGSGATIPASSFDISTIDACGGVLTKQVMRMGGTTLEDSISFICEDINTDIQVVLQITDQSGNSTTCMVTTTIDGDSTACVGNGNFTSNNQQTYSVAGVIFTDMGIGIKSVDIETSTGEYEYSDEYGNYAFQSLEQSRSYNIHPNFETNFEQGVSTLDLILIQRHLLGLESLASHNRELAADVNNDGSVDVFDLIKLRKHLLGVEVLDKSESWRFIWSESSEERMIMDEYKIQSLDSDMNIDFIGIKVGDVNGDVSETLESDSRSNIHTPLYYDIIDIGGYKEISILAHEDLNLSGMQGQLGYNADNLQFTSLNPAKLKVKPENFHVTDDQKINISYSSEKEILVEAGAVLLRLLFQSKSGNEWNYDLQFSNTQALNAEIYQDNEVYNISLERNPGGEREFVLQSNDPNPWQEKTKIAFDIPRKGMVELELYDSQNRLVYSKNKIFSSGNQSWTISNKDLPNNGIYFGKMNFDGNTQIFKMVKVD